MSMVLGTKQLYTHARVVTLYIISNRELKLCAKQITRPCSQKHHTFFNMALKEITWCTLSKRNFIQEWNTALPPQFLRTAHFKKNCMPSR